MPNLLENAIRVVSPRWAMERAYYREVLDNAPARRPSASYRGAIETRLDTPWSNSRSASGQYLLTAARRRNMVNRARQMERDNVIANALLSRAVENVVGTGLKPQALTGDPVWNRKAEAAFKLFWERPEIRGVTGPELERLFFRAHLRDGDVGCVLLGAPKLQMVLGDYIDTPPGKAAAPGVVDGVEVDGAGRPRRFHVLGFDADGKRTSTPVGERDFVFHPRRETLDEVRGVPCFSTVFALLDQIPAYTEAGVIAARIANYFSVAVKKSGAGAGFQRLDTATNGAGAAQRKINLEPGQVNFLEPDESIEQIKPNLPGAQFDQLVVALMRFAGMSLGIPLELLMLDFSRTNYSSARAALLQAQHAFEVQRANLVAVFHSRVYRWWVSKMMKMGDLPERPDAWTHKFVGDPWPYLDPTKEVLAELLEIDAGFSTTGDRIIARGGDPEEVWARRGRELAAWKRLGIPLLHAGQTMPVDQGDPFQEEDDNLGEGDSPSGTEKGGQLGGKDNKPRRPKGGAAGANRLLNARIANTEQRLDDLENHRA